MTISPMGFFLIRNEILVAVILTVGGNRAHSKDVTDLYMSNPKGNLT